ncbi:helix-loop-helix DNA-binding domain-containing protein [Ditylenchus destructor]|uniref:Helix-loop-helix DNA-binding domain-containing protein n=1 Tax=Ditylenchus destructor TaxID=166010 RepID=A0AAD4NM08_9BILA|nr:helix-loop-helix DNA-binding domain-containing protein [Ditylenchus destructor]
MATSAPQNICGTGVGVITSPPKDSRLSICNSAVMGEIQRLSPSFVAEEVFGSAVSIQRMENPYYYFTETSNCVNKHSSVQNSPIVSTSESRNPSYSSTNVTENIVSIPPIKTASTPVQEYPHAVKKSYPLKPNSSKKHYEAHSSHGYHNRTYRSSRKTVLKMLPTTVEKRNARERTRVHTVNEAFHILKRHLPQLKQNTKRVSKLKILKAAVNYVYSLNNLLEKSPSQDENSKQNRSRGNHKSMENSVNHTLSTTDHPPLLDIPLPIQPIASSSLNFSLSMDTGAFIPNLPPSCLLQLSHGSFPDLSTSSYAHQSSLLACPDTAPPHGFLPEAGYIAPQFDPFQYQNSQSVSVINPTTIINLF